MKKDADSHFRLSAFLMEIMVLPSIENLKELIHADFDAGVLYWKCRDRRYFKTDRACSWWNARFAGKEALGAVNSTGAKSGTVLKVHCNAHRVMWKMAFNEEPLIIDHINGVRTDNRIVNLRNVDRSTNSKNAKRAKNNKSGYTGVYWNKRDKVWVAMLKINGKNVYLGRSSDLSIAARIREVANATHGYHANHGRPS